MTASKCRTTHRKTLFRFHEEDPVLHDHKPNETSKAQSRTSIRSAAATAVEAADSRLARVVRPGPLLMLQQYVLSATPIVHPGPLEMRGSQARSTAAPGSVEAMGASGCVSVLPGWHNVTTTGEAREPIRWAGWACKKALACSRRGRDRSAARGMEDADLFSRSVKGQPGERLALWHRLAQLSPIQRALVPKTRARIVGGRRRTRARGGRGAAVCVISAARIR